MNFAPHDYSRVIVTAMKDEGPYILEWVAYHLSIGFTHFVIMSNDCSDGTDKIAKQLEKAGLATHLNNKPPYPKGIQKTAYARALRLDAVQKADWILALDVDEFFRIDIEDGHLDQLLDAVGESTLAISLMWQMFGHNEIISLADKPVLEQFTRASSELQANPYQIRGLKTLFKRTYFDRIGTHCPLDLKPDTPPHFQWIDGDGCPLPHMREKSMWLATNDATNFGTILGRINHYAIRSLDAFFLKMERGFVNRTARGVRSENSAEQYLKMFNWNMETNQKILRQSSKVQQYLLALKSIGNLARLHEHAFEHHQNKIKQLRENADWIKIAEISLEKYDTQSQPFPRNLSEFINPTASWEFPKQLFATKQQRSKLDPKYLNSSQDQL